MTLLSAPERNRISAAIAEVERHTDAELVTVLCASSDDYRYIPLLWAALAALIVPSALYLTPLSAAWLIAIQLLTFVVLAAILQVEALRVGLIPKAVRTFRAANMARRQFLEQGLHHTDGDTGVLIFVSEAEHYVEILVDRGIKAEIDDHEWSDIVGHFVADVRARQVEKGFLQAIEKAGELLAPVVPKTAGNNNELDDRLILLGYD